MADAGTRHDVDAAAATAPVTVERAAAILGVSASTVRRRIRDGSLRAEQAHRPQGVVWLVHLPAPATVGAVEPPVAASAVATTPATTAGDQMITYTTSLLGPLVAALERSQDRVAELEREVGRLAERVRTLEAPESHQTREDRDLTAERPEPTTGPSEPQPSPTPPPIPPGPDGGSAPWWRRWWGWLGST